MVDRKFTPKKSRGWGRSMPWCQTRKGRTMLENEWFAWRHQNKIGLKSRVQGPISSKLLKREVSSAANSMSYGLLLALNTAQRRYLFISKLSDCEIIITLTYTWSGDPGSVLTSHSWHFTILLWPSWGITHLSSTSGPQERTMHPFVSALLLLVLWQKNKWRWPNLPHWNVVQLWVLGSSGWTSLERRVGQGSWQLRPQACAVWEV